MRLKKANAALGLLSILFALLHVGYSVFAYLTMYYNPFLNNIFAYPFLVCVCLHAVLGMMSVFMPGDGRMDLYPKKNLRTVLQRISAALIFPLLLLHIHMFSLMRACAEKGLRWAMILVMIAGVLFFAVVLTHVATSFAKGFVTLGWMTSEKTVRTMDRIVYVLAAICFAVASYAVIRGQIMMFFS